MVNTQKTYTLKETKMYEMRKQMRILKTALWLVQQAEDDALNMALYFKYMVLEEAYIKLKWHN